MKKVVKTGNALDMILSRRMRRCVVRFLPPKIGRYWDLKMTSICPHNRAEMRKGKLSGVWESSKARLQNIRAVRTEHR